MGSYEGAETCELVGAYILSLLASKFKDEIGLYRGDDLTACKATQREIEKINQEVRNIFKSNGLKITIEANKKTVNILDVTFDLTSGTYKPFMKHNTNLMLSVRPLSKQPSSITPENIPENINSRLRCISSIQRVFDESIPPYQEALNSSGYKHKLTYIIYNPQPTQAPKSKCKRNRQRNITWCNSPWKANIKTNLGRKFLNNVDQWFPNNHPLHKIFNRHTLKV